MENEFLGIPKDLIERRHTHDAVGIESVKAGSRQLQSRVVVKTPRQFIIMLEKEGLDSNYYAVAKAYKAISGSLGMGAQDHSKVRGPTVLSDADNDGDLLAKYTAWYEKCKALYLAPKIVLNSIA